MALGVCNQGAPPCLVGDSAKVLRDYGVTDAESVGMEVDHLVPLAIGGSKAVANLWPQPAPDYEVKDLLERELQRRACVAYRTLQPTEAAAVLAEEQREVAEDWTAAFRPVADVRQRDARVAPRRRPRSPRHDPHHAQTKHRNSVNASR